MAVQQEIWRRDVVAYLSRGNEFAQYSRDVSGEVLNGKVVHLGQAGPPAETTKNRTEFPATIVQRGDGEVTYALDAYYGQPVLVEAIEAAELSYDKRQSVIEDNMAKLKDDVYDDLLYHWGKNVDNENVISSTGTTDIVVDLGAGALTLHGITEKDFIKLQAQFNNDRVPREDRHILLDGFQMMALKLDLASREQRLDVENIAEGAVGKLHGFNIHERSRAIVINKSTNAVLPFDALITANDVPAAIAWQKNMVESAKGAMKFYSEIGKADYYGDVFSYLMRMGGRARREQGEGVKLIKMVSVA